MPILTLGSFKGQTDCTWKKATNNHQGSEARAKNSPMKTDSTQVLWQVAPKPHQLIQKRVWARTLAQLQRFRKTSGHLGEKGEFNVFVGSGTSVAARRTHGGGRGVHRVGAPVSGSRPGHRVSPSGRGPRRVHPPAVVPEGLLFLWRPLCCQEEKQHHRQSFGPSFTLYVCKW